MSIESQARAAVDAANQPAQTAPADQGAAPGTAVALPYSETVLALLGQHTISVEQWVTALLTDQEFEDRDTEEATIGILAQILTARTSEEALASLELERAKVMCGGEPGGHSPLLEIRGARPMKSAFEEGAPCFCIVDAVYVHNGEPVRFTTGAKAVQAAIIAHIGNGWMPFQAILEIRSKPTARGFYPLNLVAGG